MGKRGQDFRVSVPRMHVLFKKNMVLDVLKKFRFFYDSSLTSVGSSKQHGHKAGPCPFKGENGIIELPLSSTLFGGFQIPEFGSYFLRMSPLFLTDLAISKLNRQQQRAFFFFHGFELFRRKYPFPFCTPLQSFFWRPWADGRID